MADNSWINSGDSPMSKVNFPTINNEINFEGMDAELYVKGLERSNAFSKDLGPPPSSMSYLRASTMPDKWDGFAVMQWPGLPPESIRKIVRENIAPQIVLYIRTNDVVRYSVLSDKVWKPGWRVESKVPMDEMPEEDRELQLRNIRQAEQFLLNCNIETTDARKRDSQGYSDFTTFLSSLVRDSLTYDGMAIYTDMDKAGRVKAFAPISAGNIRLVQPHDENKKVEVEPDKMGFGNPQYWDTAVGNWGPTTAFNLYDNREPDPEQIFAVGVDEAGNIKQIFKREDLIWATRNPRVDGDIGKYGNPEIFDAIKIIQGYQNSLELNSSTFTSNSIPNGILMLKGNAWNQRQIDVLNRIWTNLKRGITKSWTLPVVNMPMDAEMEVLDLQAIKGMEAFYQDWMNITIGIVCTFYQIPVSRIGYRISGKGPDTRMPAEVIDNPVTKDEYDNGKVTLLIHLENVINQYILSTRYPDLKFTFTGKTPSEDAREVEQRMMSMTWKEQRKLTGQPPLVSLAENEEEKKVLSLMEKCPVDPVKVPVFQALVASIYGQSNQETSGQPIEGHGDPAKLSQHGHLAGTKRDSRSEKDSAKES